MSTVAIVDVDGTLVDTNYHHTVAWGDAFREHGLVVPLWRVHRHVGMGGDKLVAAIAGAEFESSHGDDVRAAEKRRYGEMIEDVQPLEGSRELLAELRRRGHRVILASSARAEEVEHYLDLLEARELAHDWTTSADVEATKPDPDLVAAAMEKAGALSAVMVGDTPWDVKAAERAGLKTIAVLTGGFAEAELRAAGAIAVLESVATLRDRLDSTPLR